MDASNMMMAPSGSAGATIHHLRILTGTVKGRTVPSLAAL